MADVFRPKIKGERSTYYYGKVRDPRTKKWKKVSLGVTDKQAARQRLGELQRRAERVAAGLIDPLQEVPITQHLADFVRHLTQKGRSEAYKLQVECEIIKVSLFCAGLDTPSRIDRKRLEGVRSQLAGVTLDVVTVDRVDDFIAGLSANKSPRTRNSFRTSLVSFFGFLVQKRRLAFNPMLSVTRHEGAAKRVRRALTVDQLQALLDAAKVRPLAQTLVIHRGLRKGRLEANITPELRQRRERGGEERALIYLTAFYTGFRRKELRSLRVKHLILDAESPHIHLPGIYTKNGRDAKIPIGQGFAEQLRHRVEGKRPDDPVLHVPEYDELLKAFKKDLAFANIPYRDDLGRVCDFHSLRKSLGTHLRRAKVDPAISQVYMRHSDIRLTMEIYNDDQLHDLRAEVVDKLPEFSS
jgi:integrase